MQLKLQALSATSDNKTEPKLINTGNSQPLATPSTVPSFYILNPTSLAKGNAVQLLIADTLNLKPDIILITESWLKKCHSADMINIPDYNLFRHDRQKRKGGGVCVFINSKFICEKLSFPATCSMLYEFIWLRVNVSVNNSFILCAIYHPPNSSLRYNASDLLNNISKILDQCTTVFPDDYIVLSGDINTLNMTDLATEHGLEQIVTEPTHGNKILDKFYTNRPDLFPSTTVQLSSIKTKHKAVIIEPETPNCQQTNTPRRVCYIYDTRDQFIKNLASELADYKWTNVLPMSNIDQKYNSFISHCQELINKHIPKRKITLGLKDPYFISPLVKKLLRKRNKLNHLYGKLDEAAAISVKIGQLIAENKQKLMEKASHGDIETLWKAVNTTANKNSVQSSHRIRKH